MSKICPVCGADNRPSAKFCKKCAAALPDAPEPAAETVPAPAVAVAGPAAPLPAAPPHCHACGEQNAANVRFCRR